MSQLAPAPADWRRLVETERYGPMTADDQSFMRLTGLIKLCYAARSLAISPADLRGRIRAGRLRARKVGSAWYVSEAELERYMQRRLIRATVRPPQRRPTQRPAILALAG